MSEDGIIELIKERFGRMELREFYKIEDKVMDEARESCIEEMDLRSGSYPCGSREFREVQDWGECGRPRPVEKINAIAAIARDGCGNIWMLLSGECFSYYGYGPCWVYLPLVIKKPVRVKIFEKVFGGGCGPDVRPDVRIITKRVTEEDARRVRSALGLPV